MMTRYLPAAFLSVTVAFPAGAAELNDRDFQKMAAEVFAPLVKKYDIPGLAVGVTVKGQHFIYTTGKTSKENGSDVSPDTIFELGSVSKTFNVTLAALAEGRGLLSFDKPTSDYIPNLKGSAFDRIRLVNLATHTNGGLPLQVPDDVKDDAGLMAYLAHWQPKAEIDTSRSYSNVSIGLLGFVTARVMKTTYAQAAEKTLFPMIGLKSTFINVPQSAQGRYAYGHARNDDKPIRVNAGVLDAEAYGVKSTPADMLRFLDVNLGEGEVSPELKAAIEKTHTGYFQTASYVQDLIWEQYPWPVGLNRVLEGNADKMVLENQPVKRLNQSQPPKAQALLNKTGSTNGFGSYLAIIPGEKLGVVMLANRNYPNDQRVRATYQLIRMIEKADGDSTD